MMRSWTLASAKTIIERGHERGTWAGLLKRIEQSEVHLAELLPKNGDDGRSGCGGEEYDGGDADGASGDDRRWPAAIGGGTSSEDQAAAVEEMLVAETASAMAEAGTVMEMAAAVAVGAVESVGGCGVTNVGWQLRRGCSPQAWSSFLAGAPLFFRCLRT